MEKELQEKTKLHIGFIGRLEYEKWADIMRDVIIKILQEREFEGKFAFHIVWGGSYLSEFETLSHEYRESVIVYGKLDSKDVKEVMQWLDLICIPSRFLETFWLVALEWLSVWTSVCGFAKWWLREFMSESLTLEDDHPIESLIHILSKMASWWKPEVQDISPFSQREWHKNLENILNVRKNILIIQDYNYPVWWAEKYTEFLEGQIRLSWRFCNRYGYEKNPWKIQKLFLLWISYISFWRYFEVKKEIQNTQPDLIWLHNISRYIWPWWLKAVHESKIDTIITHHDLWLISARPSRVTREEDIPDSLEWWVFKGEDTSIMEKLQRYGKFWILKIIWRYLWNIEQHIVPSEFMQEPISKISWKEALVFPHCTME